MPDTVQLPSWAGEKDVRRALHIVRNTRIHADYEILVDECGRDEALRRLGEKYGVSSSTVRHIVYREQ
jgi:hypothetical protein